MSMDDYDQSFVHDGFEDPTWYGGEADTAHHDPFHVIDISAEHLEAALDDAVSRAGFDPDTDTLSDGYLSDIQGITAEYLVADALNHCGDGLEYSLYSDPTNPDVDIAGFAADGTVVRLIQVKATSDPWYAETGFHPGVEVVTTVDGYRSGMEMMNITAEQLRQEIRVMLDGT